MNQRKIYFCGCICLALFAVIMLVVPDKKGGAFTELVKIALRDAGNKLLLANHDSTSLVMPVQEVRALKYQLSFEKTLAINPDNLVAIIEESFQKASLPTHYQIEVKQCEDLEVAYSFLKYANKEKSIVPCSGRFLPQRCYTIELRFLEKITTSSSTLIWIILLIGSTILAFAFLFRRKKVNKTAVLINENIIALGKFQFYPEENKLISGKTEISLSKKEAELLTVFVANLNKVIKREELSKKVWEDHGVFVGRSLDTYISKLRKKMIDDESIKLTNVHGIGYMLEVKEI